jgi:tetratricopeptide (TPR) repeat protein
MIRQAAMLLAALVALVALPQRSAARELTEAEIRGWIDHIAKLQEARRHARRDPDLLVQLAGAYGRIGDVERALRTVRRAERAGAPRLVTRLVEADTQRRWGHNAEAIPLYLAVLDAAPAQTHALVQLWRIAVEEVVSGRESTPVLREVRGRLRGMGMFVPDVFAPAPDAAAEANRLTAEAREMLAADRPAEAIIRAEQAISQDPGFAQAFEVLFRSNDRLGEPDRALGGAVIYLEIDPDGTAARDARELVLRYWRRMNLGDPQAG